MRRDSGLIVAVWMAAMVVTGLAFVATFSTAVSLAQETKVKDGKPIFTKCECTTCHSINALGVKKQVGSEPANEEAPDLSAVGAKRTADWIKKWLTKQVTIDGKKHEKKFKGTPEELDTVAKWLETLKKKKS